MQSMAAKLLSFNKTADQRRSNRRIKFHILTTVSLIAVIFTYMFFNTHTFISNVSFNFTPKSTIPIPTNLFSNQTFIINQLKSTSTLQNPVLIVKEIIIQESKNHDQEFETQVQEFFKDCKVRFFMTWISSPLRVFGNREFLAVDALFQSNPDSCLMILSDSGYGFQILKPVTDLGFRVQVIQPDLNILFENTPAKWWYDHIKNGNRDPGEIPLAQNLSNLIRLVVLYKYGGVYIDTDFIPLKDFSGLRNSIGAQSANPSGNWTRLNNAVLIFDINHPLLYKFIEEFASTFNGNRWGFNGPYLVSRVVERVARETESKSKSNLSVLPPAAFYPVDWTRIGGLFRRPVNKGHRRWVEAKIVQLKKSSYGVHLWNKQSRGLRIEEESIMARLISDHCVACTFFNRSQRLSEPGFLSS